MEDFLLEEIVHDLHQRNVIDKTFYMNKKNNCTYIFKCFDEIILVKQKRVEMTNKRKTLIRFASIIMYSIILRILTSCFYVNREECSNSHIRFIISLIITMI